MDLSFDFFASLRRMKAGLVKPDSVAAAAALASETPAAPQAGSVTTIGPRGLALLKHFESCARRRRDGAFEAYPDPGTGGDPWTIGWGSTGKGIVRGTVWTQTECDARLNRDLVRFAREVARALGAAPTSQNQFDALVCFHYNTGAIAKATLTRLHKAARFGEAELEFGKWITAGGQRMNGLVRRRRAEADLYRSE